MQRKYLGFFIYSYSLKKEKERDRAFKAVYGDAKKSDFLRDIIFFKGKYAKEDTFSVKNGINMGSGFISGAVTPRIKLCWVPRVVERVNVAFDLFSLGNEDISVKLIDERVNSCSCN